MFDWFWKLLGRRKKAEKPGKDKAGRNAAGRSTPRSKESGKPTRGKGTPRASGDAHPRPSPLPLPDLPPGVGPNAPLAPTSPGLSLDRKLDILGIGLFFVGLLSLLSMLSPSSHPVMAAWLNMLTQTAGWGRYGLPFAFMGVGLWLVLRKFGDKLPRIDPERLLGILLMYLALLTTMHFAATPTDAEIFEIVRTGAGGGLVGAALLSALFGAAGGLGSVVILAAWWIIAIVLTAGLSVPEMVMLGLEQVRRLRARFAPKGVDDPAPAVEAEAEEPGAVSTWGTAPNRTPAVARAPEVGKTPSAAPTASTPPPLSPVQPTYDQPIVIGGEQVWTLPTVADMLEPGTETGEDDEADRQRVKVIESTLAAFGAPVRMIEINRGPTITQFGVEPDYVEQRGGKKTKVKVSKIASLADDLALALSAHSIRIQAPVPGKGYVGIEVPNSQTSVVALRDVMESDGFLRAKGKVRLGLGQDVSGSPITAELPAMPHLLIAGTTGSGKSVCVNAIIACLLLQNTPDELKFVMVDPKRVELTGYNGIPHLLTPVVVELERVVASLQWVTREMDERYRKFAKLGVRNIQDYNARVVATNEKPLHYLVVIIDELADLMMLAPDETERIITRLAQLARATGIHLIIATQRPSVDVVTGLIKANFPARIAFAVASSVDSRVILDQPGAERLLGRGDMLFQSPDAAAPVRMQGVYVSDKEIHRIVRYWRGARGLSDDDDHTTVVSGGHATLGGTATPAPNLSSDLSHLRVKTQPPLPDLAVYTAETEQDIDAANDDELLKEAIKAVREMKKASISMLQRRLRIGYTRSARLIDKLEELKIIGPAEAGAKPREVIDFGDQSPNVDLAEEEAARAGSTPKATDDVE